MDSNFGPAFFPETLIGWLQALLFLTGILTAGFSATRYWKNSTQRRMRWLYELYQRFYDNKDFQDVFTQIENGAVDYLEQDGDALQVVDRYLNFFEFIGILLNRKEMKSGEVTDMFDYPLRMIGGNSALLSYVRQYGYERLDDLLRELGYTS